jgi:hypothetical protein
MEISAKGAQISRKEQGLKKGLEEYEKLGA